MVFGHINRPGGWHLLPAVVSRPCAITPTGPRRSWRDLLATGSAESRYVATFLQRTDDPVVDEHDAQFRKHLGGEQA